MDKWYNAIEQRFSVRRYRSGISAQEMANLQKFANGIEAHGVRIAIGRSNKIFSGKIFTRKIVGTECFAAIISKNGKDLYSGYLGEIFILECVSRGYGTCWLGASFKMGAALETIELEPGESIVCVTPIGIPDEEPPYRKRLSLSELTDLTKDEFLDLPEWQQCAVESARLAPSAMNRQPWQFYIYEDSLGIVNISRNLGFGMIDCGIAMLHAELGASHAGEKVDWDVITRDDEAILYPVRPKPEKKQRTENESTTENYDDAAYEDIETYDEEPESPQNYNGDDEDEFYDFNFESDSETDLE